jgi:hypothetical protein
MPGWYAVIESHRLTAAGSPASSKPPDFLTRTETVETLENAGLAPVGLIASSDDDWDRHESLHWLTLDKWLRENSDDPDADEFRERGRHYRERYLRWQRGLLALAIFVGRKP